MAETAHRPEPPWTTRETGSRVLSFVLSPEQRNQLVYQLMNPDYE